MAEEHSPSPRRSQAELIAKIARNREEIAAHRVGLRRATHVGDRLQRSLHGNAGLFFGTAAVLGVLLSLIPAVGRAREDKKARKKVVKSAREVAKKTKSNESKSLAAIVIGMAGKAAFEAAKPVVMRMVREHYLNPQRGQGQGQSQAARAAAAGQRGVPRTVDGEMDVRGV